MRVEEETWIDIKGYEGLYQISSYGRIKSVGRKVMFGVGRVKYTDDKIKFTRVKKGYVYVKLCKNGVYTTFLVHRLVADHFLEKQDGFDQVNHLDFDGTNNRADNLEWTTRSENQKYSVKNGRGAYGQSGWDIQSRMKNKVA